MTPEGKVKKEIKAFLDSLEPDCWYYCPVPMGYGRKGIPDFIGCYKGKFFSIESKAPGREHLTTPWQEREATAITTARGVSIITDNVQRVVQQFTEKLGRAL